MDKIQKELRKLSPKEQEKIGQVLRQIGSGKTTGLDVKKLKGRDDIFRIRRGDIRIIYRTETNGKIFILAIERRKENTYK